MFLSILSPIGVKLFSLSPKFSLSLFLLGSAILEIYINLTNVLLLLRIVRTLVEDVLSRSSWSGCNRVECATNDIEMRSIILLLRIQ